MQINSFMSRYVLKIIFGAWKFFQFAGKCQCYVIEGCKLCNALYKKTVMRKQREEIVTVPVHVTWSGQNGHRVVRLVVTQVPGPELK